MRYLFVLLCIFPKIIFGNDDISRRYKVFHIALDIPLNDSEEVKKEFYINVGSNQGVKKGVVVAVYRSLSVPDQFEGRIPRDTYVKIASLRVKSSEYDSSIAEIISMEKDRPVLDVDSIMLGDEVQLEFTEEHSL